VLFFCARLEPRPNNCLRDIHGHLLVHLAKDDKERWVKAGPVGIDYYQMMRCPNDAPLGEVLPFHTPTFLLLSMFICLGRFFFV